jgi:hypothetical protein
LAAALAYSSMMTGAFLDNQPFLVALRSFGLGWMAAGMVLWVALRRDEGGRAELNLLLGLMIGLGCAILVVALFVSFSSIATYLIWGGLGLTLAALAIGVLAMVFNPAYSKPITVRWPEGGEAQTSSHIPAVDLHLPNGHPVEPDDLTRIEGIGPKVQEALNQAGIVTFVEVASRSSKQLKEVLQAAHFKGPVNSSTWSRQAELASKGDWDGLKALQKQLGSGRSAR